MTLCPERKGLTVFTCIVLLWPRDKIRTRWDDQPIRDCRATPPSDPVSGVSARSEYPICHLVEYLPTW